MKGKTDNFRGLKYISMPEALPGVKQLSRFACPITPRSAVLSRGAYFSPKIVRLFEGFRSIIINMRKLINLNIFNGLMAELNSLNKLLIRNLSFHNLSTDYAKSLNILNSLM